MIWWPYPPFCEEKESHDISKCPVTTKNNHFIFKLNIFLVSLRFFRSLWLLVINNTSIIAGLHIKWCWYQKSELCAGMENTNIGQMVRLSNSPCFHGLNTHKVYFMGEVILWVPACQCWCVGYMCFVYVYKTVYFVYCAEKFWDLYTKKLELSWF